MKFLVVWRIELARVSSHLVRAVLRMPDYARPLEEQGKVTGRYHIVGAYGGAWIFDVDSNDELEVLLARSPVYNFSHFDVYPLADMSALPVAQGPEETQTSVRPSLRSATLGSAARFRLGAPHPRLGGDAGVPAALPALPGRRPAPPSSPRAQRFRSVPSATSARRLTPPRRDDRREDAISDQVGRLQAEIEPGGPGGGRPRG